MRHSTGKSRTPLPFLTHSEETASSSNRGNRLNSLHETSSTFYEVPELIPVTSTNGIDVNSLTDDEVRERFKSVIVRISFSLFIILKNLIF